MVVDRTTTKFCKFIIFKKYTTFKNTTCLVQEQFWLLRAAVCEDIARIKNTLR